MAPNVPLYEVYSSILQRFNELGSLQQRVGNSPNRSENAWARIDGSYAYIDPSSSTSSTRYNVRTWKFEAGMDTPIYKNSAGTLVAGPTFHYGVSDASVSSIFGYGKVNVTGYGVGGTATWYGYNGSYLDLRATRTWYDTDLHSDTLGVDLATGNRGRGVAASVEAGHKIALNETWSITPQAQLSWSQVSFDTFTDRYGAEVSSKRDNSLVSRLGLSIERETSVKAIDGSMRRTRTYAIANLYHDSLAGSSARVSDLDVSSKEQTLWAGLGLGASLSWDDGRYAVFGEALTRTSLRGLADSRSIGGKFGFRMKW